MAGTKHITLRLFPCRRSEVHLDTFHREGACSIRAWRGLAADSGPKTQSSTGSCRGWWGCRVSSREQWLPRARRLKVSLGVALSGSRTQASLSQVRSSRQRTRHKPQGGE